MDANGIEEKMITWMSPNEWLVVKDLNNDGKITSGAEVVGNHMITSQGKKEDTIQALKSFDSNNDGVIDETDNSGLAFWTDRNYNGVTDVGELQGLGEAGAIQRIKLNPYQTLLSGYDSNHDGTINSSDRLSDYLYIQTNEDDSVTLYLPNSQDARDMIAGYKGNESIQTNEGEKIIRKILFYSGQMQLNNEVQGTDENDKIEGNKEANLLHGNDGRDIIDAQRGDDVISGGKGSDLLKGGSGSDTYLFNKGDGKDMIVDTAGSSDTVSFAEGISVEDIIIKSNGDDISVYLKDGDKSLSELSDQIIIKDWHNKDNRIEYISFNDGTTLDAKDIVGRFSTTLNDTVYGTDESDEIFGDKGDDTLIGRGGSDTYFFYKGDGKDTIIDSRGVDGIEFGDGITPDDLVLKGDGTNLYIGVKEDGKSFNELSQTITVKNWYNKNTRVEGIVFSDGTAWDVDDMVSHLGTDADDEIYGTERNDTLNGGVGDDVINAGGGNDTLRGGSGDDTLNGGAGSDTYIFNKGDGKDMIVDTLGNSDSITFGEGITSDDLVVKGDGTNLYIGVKEDGKSFDELSQTITVKDWYDTDNQIENITFHDGEVWSVDDIVSHIGTNEDDEMYGTENDDTLNSKEGNDLIYAEEGDDTLEGELGNDVLYGKDGNDTLHGGKGNDVLNGGGGNDSYIFNKGDGKDTILDSGGVDTIEFGEGITADDLVLKGDGTNLYIGIKEEGKSFNELSQKITINEWSVSGRFEEIKFSDGTVLDQTGILDLMQTNENDSILGTQDDEVIDALEGDDVVYAGSGNDTINGGQGDDILDGGDGNDTYIFNKGDGKDTIIDSKGTNTIKFTEGITKDDLSIFVWESDIIISIYDTETSETIPALRIVNGVTGSNVEFLEFQDGSSSRLLDMLEENVFEGTQANDTLIGNSQGDILIGKEGNDIVTGSFYGDKITGGAGNDILDGRDGDDTYIFNKGDGLDTIIDSRGRDTIQFGEGITENDITIKRDGLNLILSNQTNEDSITVANWFNDSEPLYDYDKNYNSSIDYVKFLNDELEDGLFLGVVGSVLQDGEEKNLGDINEVRGVYINPDDPLSASYVGSELDEHIYGTYGTNTLEGKGGDDVIYASGGSDIIIGGRGNDILLGGEGNDKYIFNKGDGQDIIFDSSNHYYGGTDTIEFGEGISIDDIEAELIGDDLYIGLSQEGKSITELSDKMIVKKWDEDYNKYGVETLQLNDGTTYDIAQHFNIEITEVAYPIVLDLNGNEITSTKLQDSNTYFDYDSDGERERTAWIDPGDALLVQDVNGDGKITNGAEQFGKHTLMPDGSCATSGYEALSQYDSDGNGVIDANDANYDELLLWKDKNRDGVSASDELITLQENGISSINLQREDGSVYAQTMENGNILLNETKFETGTGAGIIRDVGFVTNGDDSIEASEGEVAETGSFSESFEAIQIDNEIPVDSIEAMSDSDIDSFTLESRYTGSGLNGASAQTIFEGVGYKGTLSNVWLKSDTLDTRYSYDKEIDEGVQNLPESEGSGNVIGLQEAMNEQSELAQSVEEFQALSESGNLADFENDIDAILENWAMYDLEGETVDTTPPIVLDLNNNGVTSNSLQESNAYFDYDGDGRREKTAWIEEDDALLAVDLNADGVITHGQEIFGEYSPIDDTNSASNGYEAMKKYDTNGDNILDVNDENFSDLLVWNDHNLNGKSDEGELSTLSDNSITSIDLGDENITFEQTTENGNSITNETNYTNNDGSEGLVRDVWFQYDSSDTIAYSNLSDSDEKKIAVVERFYGRRLNSEERNSVEVIAEVLNQYEALRYDTIAKIITNKLYGEDFPNCTFLHDALNNTLGRVAGGVATTAETVLSVNLLASLLKKEHTSVLKDIYSDYFSDPTIAYLLKQSNIEISFHDGSITGHIGNRYFGDESAENYDFSGKDGVRIYTSKADDTVVGSEGIDVIIGGEGNDILDGNLGNDVLEGGQGDDTLLGSDSQNVYLYAWGDGSDTIIDAGSDENAPDTVRFTNLDISRVSIERIDDDMVIHIHDELGSKLDAFGRAFGSVTIKDGYNEGMIEHFYFKNERYDFYEVLAKAVSDTDYYFVKGDGEVSIEDNGGTDTLHFGEGIAQDDVRVKIVEDTMIIALNEEGVGFDDLKDKLTISNYQDAIEHFYFEDGTTIDINEMKLISYSTENLEGDDSDQTIYGSEENELFDAKAGDDTLYGEGGDDLYMFGLGDGNDVVYDTAGNDTVMFKEGVTLESVQSQLVGDDLILTLEDGSSLKLSSWTNSDIRIENIVDSQGNALDLSQTVVPTVYDTTSQGLEDENLQGSIEVENSEELSYELIEQPLHGTLDLDTQNGTWEYTPNENYNGEDSFKVNVINEFGGAATSNVSLNIEAINDAPEVDEAQKQITLANATTANDNIEATDVEGDALSYTLSSQPQNGSLQINDDGSWEYVANDSYLGEDSAVISISDGNGGIVEQTLNFTITEQTNQSPTLEEESVSVTLEDKRETSGEIEATDPDGDTLTYSVKTDAQHGTITVDEEGNWSYNVAGHYIGSDSAVINIDDGNGGSVEQTLKFDIKVSDPVVSDLSLQLQEDGFVQSAFSVDNPVGGELLYEVVADSTDGTFSLGSEGEFTYTPEADYYGDDSVTVKVTNAYGLSDTATLDLSIESVNDLPELEKPYEEFDLLNAREVGGRIEAFDVEGDEISYTVLSNPDNATFTVDAQGNWHYRADDSFNGTDSAVIGVDDGSGTFVKKRLDFSVDGYVYGGESFTIDSDSSDDLLLSGMNKGDFTLDKSGSDMLVHIPKDGTTVTVKDYFSAPSKGIGAILTDEGKLDLGKETIQDPRTFWSFSFGRADDSRDTLMGGSSNTDWLQGNGGDDLLFGEGGGDRLRGNGGDDTLFGGSGRDTLYGDNGADHLYGDAGRDTLLGGKGVDVLIGGSGNDKLYGEEGDDTLLGGLGNDLLKGGEGDDVYMFEKGDGRDRIFDDTPSRNRGFLSWLFPQKNNGGNDTVVLGEGIEKEDVSFLIKRGDLHLQYSPEDSLVVKNQNNDNARIEKIVLSDGNYLNHEDIDLVVQQINAYAKEKDMHRIDNETIRKNEELMQIVQSGWG